MKLEFKVSFVGMSFTNSDYLLVWPHDDVHEHEQVDR